MSLTAQIAAVLEARPDATPEEIAERAAEVRRGWAEGVAEQRLVGYVPDRGWIPPAFSFNGRHAAFEGTAVDL